RAPSANVLNPVRNALLVRAPAGIDAEGRAMEDGFDSANLAVLDPEQLGELPGPVDPVMVEEGEGEHDPLFSIDRDEPAIADPRHDASDARFELLLAGDAGAAARQHVDAVLEPHAIVGKRVIPLAVVVLE